MQQRWLRCVVAGWIALIVLGELLIRTAARDWGVIAVFDLVQPWWYAPTLPCLLLVLISHQRRGTMVLLLVGAVWLTQYGARWLPKSPATAPANLRVLTWNVAGWNVNIADLDRVISAENSDIIALQEVDEALREPLLARWRDRYPWSEIRLPTEPGLQPADLAVFSRYPFAASPLDCPYWQCYRRALAVDVNGRELTLINVHIEHSPVQTWHGIPSGIANERETRTIRRLLADTAIWHEPLLIMGDFNTTERQTGYALLAARWSDTWHEQGRGLGLTWPRTTLTPPLLRLDYIWHSPHFTATHATVGSGASDHRYVVADLYWQ